MIQCPKCGAEYKVSPDVCVQCGYDFAPEDSLPDLFAAAMKQEQQSRAQQQAQREAFRKLHGEKHPQHNPEPDMLPELPNDVPETEEPEPLPEAVTQSESRTAPQPKRNNPKWTPYVIGVIAVLFAAAIISLRDGFKPVHAPTDNYAYYLQDQTIWFYRDDTGKKICLTDHGKPHAELPDSYVQKLTQLSADGKRVYYPLNFTQSDTCQIAYRELAAPEEEHILTWIRMFPDAQRTVQETGRLEETEAFPLIDMLPPYIIDGDVLFYINPDGDLCRLRSGGEEEVLTGAAVRYWKISGEEGIYYLALNDYEISDSVNSYPAHLCPNTVGSTALPWSVTEYSTYGSCELFCCKREGESECYYPFPEIQIENWAVPYADSDQYFYFCQQYDEDRYLFVQSDLKTPRMYEVIHMTGDYSIAAPQLLCAYPDGSFYYATVETPTNAFDENVFLHYFKRKEDQAYQVFGYEAANYLSHIDICRTAPYLALCHDTMETTHLFSGPYSAALNVPADAKMLYGKRAQFDTQYPVLFLNEDRLEMLKKMYALSSDSRQIAKMAEQITDEQAQHAYYCVPEGWSETEFRDVPNQMTDSSYFAFQPEGASAPEIFCWDQQNSELLLPDGQKAQADRIIRKDGGLFCHSGTDNSISIYRDNALQSLTGADMQFSADNWQPLSGDTVLAVSEDRKLVLYTSEQMKKIGAADRIIAAGKLPQEKEHTE